MIDEDFDFFDFDVFHNDKATTEKETLKLKRRGQALQIYERLMEKKRLKNQLDDEIGYW